MVALFFSIAVVEIDRRGLGVSRSLKGCKGECRCWDEMLVFLAVYKSLCDCTVTRDAGSC